MIAKIKYSLFLLSLSFFPTSAKSASLVFCKEYNHAIIQKNLKFSIEIVEPLPLLTSSVPTIYLVYENSGPVSISVPILKRSDGISYGILYLQSTKMPDGTTLETYESTATRTPVGMYSGCSPQMQSMIPGERIKLKLAGALHAPWSDKWNGYGGALSNKEERQMIRVSIGPYKVDKVVEPVKPKVIEMMCIPSEKPIASNTILHENCAYAFLLEAGDTQFVSVTLNSYESNSALSDRDMLLRSSSQHIVLGWSKQPIEAKVQSTRKIDSAKSVRIRLGAKDLSLEELWEQRELK